MITIEKLKEDYYLYFSLAYFIEVKRSKFIKISEHPSDKIIHVLVHHDDIYLDAMDQYTDLKDSVNNIDSIKTEDLIFENITYDQIVKYILNNEFRFDNELFMKIRTFVRNQYHLPNKSK